jgi:hypothetical protein
MTSLLPPLQLKDDRLHPNSSKRSIAVQTIQAVESRMLARGWATRPMLRLAAISWVNHEETMTRALVSVIPMLESSSF